MGLENQNMSLFPKKNSSSNNKSAWKMFTYHFVYSVFSLTHTQTLDTADIKYWHIVKLQNIAFIIGTIMWHVSVCVSFFSMSLLILLGRMLSRRFSSFFFRTQIYVSVLFFFLFVCLHGFQNINTYTHTCMYARTLCHPHGFCIFSLSLFTFVIEDHVVKVI